MRLPKVGGMPFFDRFTVILELGFFGKSRLFSVSRTFGRGILFDKKQKHAIFIVYSKTFIRNTMKELK